MADIEYDLDASLGGSSPAAKTSAGKGKGGKPAPAGAIPEESDTESSWPDHLRNLGAGIVNTAGDVMNATRRYASKGGYDTAAGYLDKGASAAYETGDEITSQMSENARRNASPKYLSMKGEDALLSPDSKVDKSSAAAHVAESLVPSIGVSAAGAYAGAAAGSVFGPVGAMIGGAAGLMGGAGLMAGGQINREIFKELSKATPEQLGDRYTELRQSGKDDRAARLAMADEAGGAWQDGAAVFSGVLNGFGPVGGAILRKFGGGAITKATGGALARTAKEGFVEGIDNASQEVGKQGALNRDYGADWKPMEIAEAAAQGVVTGPLGALTGRHNRGPSAAENAALDARKAPAPQDGEAIPTMTRDTPSGQVADTAIKAAEQRVQEAGGVQGPPPAPPAAPAPPVTEGPVPPQAAPQAGAIPEQAPAGPEPFDPMQGRREMMRTGAQDEATGNGPLPTTDPMADRRDAMRPGEGTVAQPVNPSSAALESKPFLQAMADENNGQIDPARIAGYLSQRGQSATWQQVTAELAPLVEQGILRQSNIPGPNGQPMFSMATERQGPEGGPRSDMAVGVPRPAGLGVEEAIPTSPTVQAVGVPGPAYDGPTGAVGVPGPTQSGPVTPQLTGPAAPKLLTDQREPPRLTDQRVRPQVTALGTPDAPKAAKAKQASKARKPAPAPKAPASGATIRVKGGDTATRQQALNEVEALLARTRGPEPTPTPRTKPKPAAPKAAALKERAKKAAPAKPEPAAVKTPDEPKGPPPAAAAPAVIEAPAPRNPAMVKAERQLAAAEDKAAKAGPKLKPLYERRAKVIRLALDAQRAAEANRRGAPPAPVAAKDVSGPDRPMNERAAIPESEPAPRMSIDDMVEAILAADPANEDHKRILSHLETLPLATQLQARAYAETVREKRQNNGVVTAPGEIKGTVKVPTSETGPGTPRFVPAPEGVAPSYRGMPEKGATRVVENPARAEVDARQDVPRQVEADTELARTVQAQEGREATKLRKAGVASPEVQANRPRASYKGKGKFKALTVPFMTRDKEGLPVPKKWENMVRLAERIRDIQLESGMPVHPLVRDIVVHARDVGGSRARLNETQRFVRDGLMERVRNGEWDRDAGERYNEIKEGVVARMPSEVFNEFAPPDGKIESPQEVLDRLQAMATAYAERQPSGYNPYGNQNEVTGRTSDPYGQFIRSVLSAMRRNAVNVQTTRESGKPATSPLVWQTDAQARASIGTGGIVRKRGSKFVSVKERAGIKAAEEAAIARNERVHQLVANELLLRHGDVNLYKMPAASEVTYGTAQDIGRNAEQTNNEEPLASLGFERNDVDPLNSAEQPGVLERGTDTGTEALQKLFPGYQNGEHGPFGELASALQERVGNVPVETVSAQDMRAHHPTAWGVYLPSEGRIYLRDDLSLSDQQGVLLHEMVHAATYQGLKDPTLAPMGEALLAEARQEFTGYPMRNVDELVAHGFTDPHVQRLLAGRQISPELAKQMGVSRKLSLREAFVDLVRRALGMGKTNREMTMLDAVMHLGQQAMEQNPDGARFRPEQDMLASMGASDLSARAKDQVGALALNGGVKFKRTFLGLHTITDLVTNYDHLFDFNSGQGYLRLPGATGTIQQFEYGGAMRSAQAKQLAEKDLERLDKLRDHMQRFPEENKVVAELISDANTHHIDPREATPPGSAQRDTANGRLAMRAYTQLRERYLALPQRAQEAFSLIPEVVQANRRAEFKTFAYGTALMRYENAMAAAKGRELPPGIQRVSQADANAMAERALNDELTDADLAHYGKSLEEAFKSLRGVLRSSQFYTPKNRFGDFVLSGTRTDYQRINYFDTEAEAEAFARKAQDEGVPLGRNGVFTRTFDASGDHVASNERAGRKDLTSRYAVEVHPQIVEFFDTASEAAARLREYDAMPNVAMSGIEPRKRGETSNVRDLDATQMGMITKAVESIASNEEDKAQLHDMLQEVFARLDPTASTKHSSLRRRNIMGASNDLVRTLGNHIQQSARYRADLNNRVYQKSALRAMEDVANRETMTPDGRKNNMDRRLVVGELRARINSADETGTPTSPFWRGVQRYTSLHYLASPSYTLLQFLQNPMMGPGVLAGIHGNATDTQIASAMLYGHNAVGGYGMAAKMGGAGWLRAWRKYAAKETEPTHFLQQVKNNIAEHADDPAMAKEYHAMLDRLAALGRVDEVAGLEVGRVMQMTKQGAFGRAFSAVEDLSRAFPAAAEVYNRSSIAVASYKLARENGASVEEATKAADDAVVKAHFVYNAENAPRLMNASNKFAGGVLSPILTFKKFVQAIYMQVGRSFYQSMRGETPEVRRLARRQFSRLMITHGAIAGAMGLPIEGIRIAAGLVALLSGEDEPYDYEEPMQKALISAFGGGADGVRAANAIMHGLPNLLGIDVSSRTEISQGLFGRGPQDFTPEKLKEYGYNLVTGAAGGIAGGMVQGLKTYRDTGNITKAVQQMAPKAIKDAMTAAEIATTGKMNAKGVRTDAEGLGAMDVAIRAAGFKSTKESNMERERAAGFAEDARMKRDRPRIYSQMAAAEKAGRDPKVIMDKWNAANPFFPVSEKGFAASKKNKDAGLDPANTYLGRKIPAGGLPPSIYVPERAGAPITKGSASEAIQRAAPTKETLPRQTSAYAPTGVSTDAMPSHPFLRAIVQAEGTGRDQSPYEEVLGYGQYGRPSKPLTQMTLREAYNFGRTVRGRHGSSSALGAYQIVGRTMQEYMGEAGLSWGDTFSPENQDKLAIVIARRQGVKPSTWEGFRNKPVLLAKARAAFRDLQQGYGA